MSKTLKMWGHRGSSCCQKVLWSAAELGLSIDLTDTGGGYGGLGMPEYIARNPNRVVPTIDDDGFVMWESSAILLYLASAYGRGTLEPEDPQARGDAYRWTVWQDTTMRQKLLPLNHSWIIVENDNNMLTVFGRYGSSDVCGFNWIFPVSPVYEGRQLNGLGSP